MSESEGSLSVDARPSIAFLGDSITASGDWAAWLTDERVVNLAVSGETTLGLLSRVNDIIAERPDEICLLIGTNDVGSNRSVEHIVRNIQMLLVELRRELPDVKILVQSIMPRDRKYSGRIQEANIHLWQFAPTVHALYLDLWPALADDSGAIRSEFSRDALHLTDAGYEAWRAELLPALSELRELPPISGPVNTVV